MVLMFPVQRKYPHDNTTSVVARRFPGSQSVRSNFFQTRPPNSWTMNRATRVPASIVVRIKSASNMMAKWYQNDMNELSPGIPEKIWANPTASETAPPGRPATVSPTSRESSARFTVGMPSAANFSGVQVDREVVARMQGAGGDQRHDADHALPSAWRHSR